MPKHYRPPGKKKEGNAARYVTRPQAVKHLQVTLPVFRRLCILKGVFPREPKKKVKGNHHTYYHSKDILFLKHEPLLEKFRDMRAYEKKVKKALSKKNKDLAERLLTRKPTYTLDMLIRERYPSFIDALRDLDDCLTMVHLFAALPAIEREKIEVKRIHNCRRLRLRGKTITWLTPHALQQVVPDAVDYKIMLTFLEFYETLLAFVNFKLYHSINVKYPPILDPRLEALAAGMVFPICMHYQDTFDADSKVPAMESQAVSSSGSEQGEAQKQGPELDESELRLAQLQRQLPSNEPGALMHLVEDAFVEDEDDEETKECKTLFKNMKFFLSREVPRESLLFVIPAFGGVVSWEGEGAPFNESDQSITHQIVDRPTQGRRFLSREYVRPQWLYDCVNARIILPVEEYLVGRVPPPHLSPFVDNEAEGYVPEYAETIRRLQATARKEVLPLPGLGNEDLDDPQNLLVEGIISRTEAIEAAEKKQKMSILEKQYHDELKMELQGVQYPSVSNANKQNSTDDTEDGEEPLPDLQQVAEDAANMSKVVMSRKKRKLYEAMQIGKKRKQSHVDLLKERKKKIEGKKSE
ncbi:pescadillo-like protein [Actinidia rufa]|uniref:Pescadillo homolog n=1 Tax=Actinidia rufa TaxID=165716 RepID=A0A7J0FJA6_9ERIC|nr:pescadillo-like protein [Actinidia rufa]